MPSEKPKRIARPTVRTRALRFLATSAALVALGACGGGEVPLSGPATGETESALGIAAGGQGSCFAPEAPGADALAGWQLQGEGSLTPTEEDERPTARLQAGGNTTFIVKPLGGSCATQAGDRLTLELDVRSEGPVDLYAGLQQSTTPWTVVDGQPSSVTGEHGWQHLGLDMTVSAAMAGKPLQAAIGLYSPGKVVHVRNVQVYRAAPGLAHALIDNAHFGQGLKSWRFWSPDSESSGEVLDQNEDAPRLRLRAAGTAYVAAYQLMERPLTAQTYRVVVRARPAPGCTKASRLELLVQEHEAPQKVLSKSVCTLVDTPDAETTTCKFDIPLAATARPVRFGIAAFGGDAEVFGARLLPLGDGSPPNATTFCQHPAIDTCSPYGTLRSRHGLETVDYPVATTLFATSAVPGTPAGCPGARTFPTPERVVIPAVIPVHRGYAVRDTVILQGTRASGGPFTCTYGGNGGSWSPVQGEFYSLMSCTGSVTSGQEVSLSSVSLSFGAAVSHLGQGAAHDGLTVAMRLLPKAKGTPTEKLDLIPTAIPAVTFTKYGEHKRVEVRAFVDTQEVDASTLGIVWESLRSADVASHGNADGSVSLESKKDNDAYNVLGARATAHPSRATTSLFAQVWKPKPQSRALIVAAKDLVFPAVSQVTFADDEDDVVCRGATDDDDWVGPFPMSEILDQTALAPVTPTPTTPPDASPPAPLPTLPMVVRGDAAARLVVGSLVSAAGGQMVGRVTSIVRRDGYARLGLAWGPVTDAFDLGTFEYNGELETLGYNLSFFGPIARTTLDFSNEPTPSGANPISGTPSGSSVAPRPAIPAPGALDATQSTSLATTTHHVTSAVHTTLASALPTLSAMSMRSHGSASTAAATKLRAGPLAVSPQQTIAGGSSGPCSFETNPIPVGKSKPKMPFAVPIFTFKGGATLQVRPLAGQAPFRISVGRDAQGNPFVSTRASGQFELGANFDFTVQLAGSARVKCPLVNRPFDVPFLTLPVMGVPFGLVGQANPAALLDLNGRGGPRFGGKFFGSVGLWFSIGIDSRRPGGVSDDQPDLNADGKRTLFEIKPFVGGAFTCDSILCGSGMGSFPGLSGIYEPDWLVEVTPSLSPEMELALVPFSAKAYVATRARIQKMKKSPLREQLLKGTDTFKFAKGQLLATLGPDFGYHSAGNLLNEFSAVQFYCQEVQRVNTLAIEVDYKFSVFDDALTQLKQRVPGLAFLTDIGLSAIIDTNPIVVTANFQCMNPALLPGHDTVVELRRKAGQSKGKACDDPTRTDGTLHFETWSVDAGKLSLLFPPLSTILDPALQAGNPDTVPLGAGLFVKDPSLGQWTQVAQAPVQGRYPGGYTKYVLDVPLAQIKAANLRGYDLLLANKAVGVLSLAQGPGGIWPSEIGANERTIKCDDCAPTPPEVSSCEAGNTTNYFDERPEWCECRTCQTHALRNTSGVSECACDNTKGWIATSSKADCECDAAQGYKLVPSPSGIKENDTCSCAPTPAAVTACQAKGTNSYFDTAFASCGCRTCPANAIRNPSGATNCICDAANGFVEIPGTNQCKKEDPGPGPGPGPGPTPTTPTPGPADGGPSAPGPGPGPGPGNDAGPGPGPGDAGAPQCIEAALRPGNPIIKAYGKADLAKLGFTVRDGNPPAPDGGPGWCPAPNYVVGVNTVSGSSCHPNNAPGCLVNNGYPMQGTSTKFLCVPPILKHVPTGYGMTPTPADMACPAPANLRVVIDRECTPNNNRCDEPGYPGCGPGAATKACEGWNGLPPGSHCFAMSSCPTPL